MAAGFNSGSHAAQIVAAVRRGDLMMVWNRATREEILLILNRIPPLDAAAAADLFRPAGEHAADRDLQPYSFIPDRADRVFAALAEAAGATLVSNDSHLLDHRHKLAVPVLTPREFWQRWQVRE